MKYPYIVGQREDGTREVLSPSDIRYQTSDLLAFGLYEIDKNSFERIILYQANDEPYITFFAGEKLNGKEKKNAE